MAFSTLSSSFTCPVSSWDRRDGILRYPNRVLVEGEITVRCVYSRSKAAMSAEEIGDVGEVDSAGGGSRSSTVAYRGGMEG